MAKKMDKHIYSAKVVRVVDGDTADAMIDLGFDTWVKKRIGLWVWMLGKVELVTKKKK